MVCAMEGEELITVLLLILVLSFPLFFKSRRRHRLPPSPVGLPVIGHLHLLTPIPHQALHKLSTRYGPLIHLRLGSVCCVVASSAATAKELLRTHDLSFSDRPPSKAVSYLTYGLSDFSFAPYGAYWRFMKKLCVSELLGGRTLDQLLPIRREEVVALMQTLHDKSQERQAIDMGGELIRFTNNVISRMTMSRRCSGSEGESDEIRRLVEEVSELTGKFNLADYIGLCKNLDLQGFDRRLEDVRRRFDDMMEKILKDKEAGRAKRTEMGGGRQDLLDMLIDISEDASAETRLTRDNIKAFVMVLLS
ncbi:hypothetical protein GW17_00013341 [Ensete ventricosum]|nr:hypothetical protein GW17_00013341 [Ensete ventricosum]